MDLSSSIGWVSWANRYKQSYDISGPGIDESICRMLVQVELADAKGQ